MEWLGVRGNVNFVVGTGVAVTGRFGVNRVSGEVCNSFVRRLNETICNKVCRPNRPATSRGNFERSIVRLIGGLGIPVIHCPNNGFISNCG